MEAVVTGSAGFIGGHLVDALVERGYRVSGIDRHSRDPVPGYEHRVIDLADDPHRNGLARILDGADLVFHLAAKPGVRGTGPGIEHMRRRDNVDATRNLLSFVPKHIPVVATSSASVYGGSRDGVASHEDDPLRPRGGYARSKIAMEQVCRAYRSNGGRIAVVRPFTVAGEGQRPDMAFSMWLAAIQAGEPIRIFGSGSRSRDITDIRDAVEGLIRAGERGVNETVNLGTGCGHRLTDMTRVLLDMSGIPGHVVNEPVSAEEADVTLADTTRCRQLLGFVPRTDLRSLISRQIAASAPRPAMAVT